MGERGSCATGGISQSIAGIGRTSYARCDDEDFGVDSPCTYRGRGLSRPRRATGSGSTVRVAMEAFAEGRETFDLHPWLRLFYIMAEKVKLTEGRKYVMYMCRYI